ncbi:MAG: glycosyltransferase family A protein [Candidatus Margulisiibacteriota bacterium]|jgi:glycosyltransferase involved in cell wall biosynthesis
MISVIIPTYNHKNELPRCLSSLEKQTYKDIEIIVVDDGSDYDVVEVIKYFPTVKFFKLNHQGAPAARNFGFTKSIGQYVIFLDDDVVMQPETLEKMKNVLNINQDISYVYSTFKIGRKIMKFYQFQPTLLKQFNYIHTSSLMRREVFTGFDVNLKKFQDWDLWLTLLANNKYGKGINEVLYKIINPRAGHMSTWLPKFVYKLPWPIFGFIPKILDEYFQAKEIIKTKHNL